MTTFDLEFERLWALSLLGWAVDWIEQHNCVPNIDTHGKDLQLMLQARNLVGMGKPDPDVLEIIGFLLISPDARRAMKSSVMREMLVSVGADFGKLDAAKEDNSP